MLKTLCVSVCVCMSECVCVCVSVYERVCVCECECIHMHVHTHTLRALWCLTLCDPMGCSPLASSDHGIFQARIIRVGCHLLLQGISPTQRANLQLLLGRQIVYPGATWEVPLKTTVY